MVNSVIAIKSSINESTSRREPIVDLNGNEVKVVGSRWMLNSPAERVVLDWAKLDLNAPEILRSTKEFVAHEIATLAASSVKNTFEALLSLLNSESFRLADLSDSLLPFAVFTETREAMGPSDWRLHYIRKWYGWCAERGYSNFSLEVAFRADQLVIGGNDKGHAVLSADPSIGPLSDLETSALILALKSAGVSGRLSLNHQCALWLCLGFGPNPRQLALLTEDDLVAIRDGDTIVSYQLKIPRMKKRDNRPRGEFRTRRLAGEISEVLTQMLAQTSSERTEIRDRGFSVPMFLRRTVRKDLADGPLHEFSYHMSANEFAGLVKEAVQQLGIVSHRTGQLLVAGPRRFRYTFATRLVRDGVPKAELADLLDHTDTQNVDVYYNISSDIVEHLDRATALALAPVAQAFMGRVVANQKDAATAHDFSNIVQFFDGTEQSLKTVGGCGTFSFCRLAAPVACYTCVSFQPWVDGPHELILNDLLSDRERRAAKGLDGRVTTMLDATILAVAQVIAQIQTMVGAGRENN